MKVLIHTYETAFQNKAGGVHNRIVRLVSELKKQGIQVEFFNKYTTTISDYDILHIFKLDSGTKQLVDYAKSVGVKVIVSSIVSLEKGGLVDFYWFIRRLPFATLYKQLFHICDIADGIIVETPKEAKFMARYYHVPHEKLYTIPNGADHNNDFDDSIYARIGKSCSYATIVGRFDKNKNQLNVIKALKDTNCEVVFIGGPDPANVEYYEECKKTANHSHNIHFMGWLNSEDKLFKSILGNARAIVCPSYQETFGLSIIEGMMAGATPVVSKTLPILDYDEMKNCITFDPDNTKSIREAIECALSCTPERERNVNSVFSWESVSKSHIKLYEKLCKKL